MQLSVLIASVEGLFGFARTKSVATYRVRSCVLAHLFSLVTVVLAVLDTCIVYVWLSSSAIAHQLVR